MHIFDSFADLLNNNSSINLFKPFLFLNLLKKMTSRTQLQQEINAFAVRKEAITAYQIGVIHKTEDFELSH
jgi:hypothetical protein